MSAKEKPTALSTALPHYQLRLAMADCQRHPDFDQRSLPSAMDRLWREDRGDVIAAYDTMIFGSLDSRSSEGRLGLHAERMRRLRRPLPTRDKRGLRLSEIATVGGMSVATLAALMEHHGYLELVPYEGTQRRRLVTDKAFHAGLGHNVDPRLQRSRRLEGAAKAAVFPVFYTEEIETVLWTLDWENIKATASRMAAKKDRMRWALRHHSYLPRETLCALTGYSERGFDKARANAIDTSSVEHSTSMAFGRTFPSPPSAPLMGGLSA